MSAQRGDFAPDKGHFERVDLHRLPDRPPLCDQMQDAVTGRVIREGRTS